MHMNKVRTTITINKDLLDKAKSHNISISSFLDIELRRYIAFIEGNQGYKSHNPNQVSGTTTKDNQSKNVKRPGRNLNPSPELDRLG